MSQEIKLEIIDDKVKVSTPYNADFVQKCRNFRGKFIKSENAWYFDDSIIDYVREAMIEFFGTTGEAPYEDCSLLIENYTESAGCRPVVLFGRTIARAFGRDSGAKLGDDIIFVSGEYDSGGSVKNWATCVTNATFEIQNFPLPATELPDVQKAIEEGWCKIKRKPGKTVIKHLNWNDPLVYSIIGPYAMDRKVVRELDNQITTAEGMTWFFLYDGSELKAFGSIERTNVSMSIKNLYAIDGNKHNTVEIIKHIKTKCFNESEVKKLYAYFTTEDLGLAKELGFKQTTPGKNWHKMIIEK